MDAKIRSIEPSLDDATAEEYVVRPSPDAWDAPEPVGSPADRSAADRRSVAPEATREMGDPPVVAKVGRAVTADELGPNGVRVRELLDRAAALSDGECRRLEEEAGWRWWPLTPVAGANVAAARSAALVQGRTHGRAEAIVVLEAAVQDVLLGNAAAASKRSRLPACIANAGLAVLVEDLIELETFEILYAPWRAVFHQ